MLTALKNLGLSEKEAKVYLAALELGSSSVQKIGRQAGVNRATTYVMIESLIKRGLVSSFEQGKKRLFAATHPSQLLRLIKQKELDIQELKENLEKDLLPQLLSIHNIAGDKPKVRFFEGQAGLQAMRDDFLRTTDKQIEAVYPLEDYKIVFSEKENKEYRETRRKKNIFVKALYASSKNTELPYKGEYSLSISLPFKKFPLSADITFYNNKVALASFKKNTPCGVIIENKEMADTLRMLFNLAWKTALKYKKNSPAE